MKIKSLIFLFWMCLGTVIYGQTIVASVNNNLIELDETVTVTFTINNQSAKEFTPPNFANFKIVGGPSQSQNYQEINGVATRSFQVSYTLQPLKLGKLKIEAAKVIVKGKAYNSNPFYVTVTKGIIRDYFVKMEVNDSSIYVGQQLVLEFVLYTQADISNYDKKKALDFDGFYHKTYRTRERGQAVEINGKPYTKQVLEREILYPQRTGTFSFGPIPFQLGLTDKNSKGRGGFFSFQRTIPKMVSSNSIKLKVNALPPTNEDFSGAVGRFEIFSSINKTTLKQNEALSVFVSIRGDGDIKNVMPPTLDLGEGFDVFDAKVKDEVSELKGRREISKKVFEYVIIPKNQGRPIVQPSFTYFNTDSLKYITQKSQPFRLNILAAKATANLNIKDNSETFSPIQRKFHTVSTETWQNKPWSFALVLLPFIFIGLITLFDLWKRKNAPQKEKLKKQNNASKKAKLLLSKAQEHLSNNEDKSFYAEVAKALRKFVEEKFGIKATTLSKSKISAALAQTNADKSSITNLEKMLNDCEMGQFGMSTVTSPPTFYDMASDLIDQLDK